MTDLFKKLNLTNHSELLVLNAPPEFEPELEKLHGRAIRRDLHNDGPISFAIVFATKQAEVDKAAEALAPALEGDAVVWFAYPKGSSRKYKCDFNRDTGWGRVGALGLEPVRQVAIDQDWSALRFRRVEYIRKLTRDPSRTVSEAGKARTQRRGGD